MQSHIILHFASAIIETLSLSRLPHFCSWPIQYALAHLITLQEGQILRQSFSSFLAHIDMFEYLLEQDITITYSRTDPSIFMFLIFDGSSSLYTTPDKLISENPKGAFHMGYINKGHYTAKVKAGKTKLLLLTLRTDWLARKAEKLPAFEPIIAHFLAAEQPNFYLPDCPMTWEVNNLTKKMLLHDNYQDLDITIDSVLNQLISQYHDMAIHKNYTTEVIHDKMAATIATYVQANFKDKSIDDISDLSKKFGLSIANVNRLAKLAFHKPLREQVITLRMQFAMEQLLTTNKSIHEIAFLAGYNDPHYFSRAFKKFFKKSPKQFRAC